MDVLIAPQDVVSLTFVAFPFVKDPSQMIPFFFDEQNICLYEAYKFLDPHRSWFLENDFERSGHIIQFNKFDPLFIFLPEIMDQASNQFKSVDDICTSFNLKHNSRITKLDYALSPNIVWSRICDVKEVCESTFVRYSETNTLRWLAGKYERTIKVIRDQGILEPHWNEGDSSAPQVSNATYSSYAQDFVAQYIPESLVRPFKNSVRDIPMTINNSKSADKRSDKNFCDSKMLPGESLNAEAKIQAGSNPRGSKRQAPQAPKNPKGTLLQYFDKKK